MERQQIVGVNGHNLVVAHVNSDNSLGCRMLWQLRRKPLSCASSPWGRAKEKAMLRFIALVAVTAALSLPPVIAHAQTGYGVKPGAPSTSTFDRKWNRANESKDRARAGAEYMRERRAAAAHSHHRHPPSHPVQ